MISVEGFKRLGVEPDPVFHQNTVYGGRVYSSDGSCITIKDTKSRAYIVDRGVFDKHLAECAVDAGADIRFGSRVDEVKFKKGSTSSLKIGSSEVRAKVFIDAEGPKGRLLARSGIDTGQQCVYNGFNTELMVDSVEDDMVEVWFDTEIAKDFFAWVIPLGENRVRCGLGTSQVNGADKLRGFVKKRFNRDVDIIHGGLICTGGPVNKTAYPGLMLVGDVAGQVKPTTAGGVVIGGLCAKIAGETTVKALESESVQLISEYDVAWRAKYGSELQTMLFLRSILNGLDNNRINRIFHAFIEEGLEEKFTRLVEDGDMDMQADVIKRAVSDPVILGALAKSAGRIALSEILAVFGF
jgi:digeranylgeranylglycerophospholipid reductase